MDGNTVDDKFFCLARQLIKASVVLFQSFATNYVKLSLVTYKKYCLYTTLNNHAKKLSIQIFLLLSNPLSQQVQNEQSYRNKWLHS